MAIWVKDFTVSVWSVKTGKSGTVFGSVTTSEHDKRDNSWKNSNWSPFFSGKAKDKALGLSIPDKSFVKIKVTSGKLVSERKKTEDGGWEIKQYFYIFDFEPAETQSKSKDVPAPHVEEDKDEAFPF